MNYIFYHITSASLSWNPFIHFSHTIHIITLPDIVTGWHILCLIYFSCTIQVLIKQEQRSPHSWCHYTNFQKGAAPLSWPLQSDHQALSLARGPVTLPPKPSCGLLDTSRVTRHHSVKDHLLNPRQHSIDHMANSAPVAYTHPESWQIEHYYILYFKSPTISPAVCLLYDLSGSAFTVRSPQRCAYCTISPAVCLLYNLLSSVFTVRSPQQCVYCKVSPAVCLL